MRLHTEIHLFPLLLDLLESVLDFVFLLCDIVDSCDDLVIADEILLDVYLIKSESLALMIEVNAVFQLYPMTRPNERFPELFNDL